MWSSAAGEKLKETGSAGEINNTGETKAGFLCEAGHPGGRSRIRNKANSSQLSTLKAPLCVTAITLLNTSCSNGPSFSPQGRLWQLHRGEVLAFYSSSSTFRKTAYSISPHVPWKLNNKMVLSTRLSWPICMLVSFWSFSKLHFYSWWEWKRCRVLISGMLWGRTLVSFTDVVGNQSRVLWDPRGVLNNDSNVATQPVLVGIWSKHTLSCVKDTQQRPRQQV